MCIRCETREKARRSLAFSRVSKPHTHITYMLRIVWVELVTTLWHFARVATVWSSTEIDDSRLTMTCFSNMLSKMAVDSRLNVSSEVKFVYFGNG
jgi:hypothetical protein